MKKKILLFIFGISAISTCSEFPILSDLTNTRMSLKFKGTYESNSPYGWNSATYMDDALSTLTGDLGTADALSGVDFSMFLDIADMRLSTGTGKPSNVTPEEYWTYFTKKREVFCSNTNPNGYNLVTCVNDKGDQDYTDFFNEGYNFPATDVPEATYRHFAIFFRKFVISPAYEYDSSNLIKGITQTTFDNRTIHGMNLMDSIIQYADTDTKRSNPLMFPLERTDLSLRIPAGNDPYVLEVRIFIKNLLMKHYVQDASNLPLLTAGDPVSFIGPSDWKYNHNTTDPDKSLQMGGNIIFTARIYDPATVGSLEIKDSESIPSFKSYYAVVPAGQSYADASTFITAELPYAATSRQAATDINANGTTENGFIDNLPAGTYDLYKTCDLKLRDSSGLVNGEDGFPETAKICRTDIIVTKGQAKAETISTTDCQCP